MPLLRKLRLLAFFLPVLMMTSCTAYLRPGNIRDSKTYFRRMNLETGGYQRSYYVHIPTGYDQSKPLPLVVVIHGAFDTGKGMETFSGFSRLADREQFIVLYPNGIGILGYLQHWNAGHCCGKAAADNIDDVGYLEAAIKDVRRRLAVDAQRIYMTGFSNGGMMTYRFAAEKGDMLAAAAPLAASIGGKPSADAPEWRIPKPVKPLPLLVMHGMDDNDIHFKGGRSAHRNSERTYWSVNDSVQFWVENNQCRQGPLDSGQAGGAVQIQTWKDCSNAAEVRLYKIQKWGHIWPGPYYTANLPDDDPLHDFDAAEIIWQFFKRFPKAP